MKIEDPKEIREYVAKLEKEAYNQAIEDVIKLFDPVFKIDPKAQNRSQSTKYNPNS